MIGWLKFMKYLSWPVLGTLTLYFVGLLYCSWCSGYGLRPRSHLLKCSVLQKYVFFPTLSFSVFRLLQRLNQQILTLKKKIGFCHHLCCFTLGTESFFLCLTNWPLWHPVLIASLSFLFNPFIPISMLFLSHIPGFYCAVVDRLSSSVPSEL